MYPTRHRTTNWRRGLRMEPLESRTLLHAGTFSFANGVIDIVPDHGDNTIRVRWDETSRSVGVFLNGQEQLRAAGPEVRALSLRGLRGNDIVYMDARLNLPVSYDRGGSQGVLLGQLTGYHDYDYYVATPGCTEFAYVCETGEHTKPTRDAVVFPDANTAVVRAMSGSHSWHQTASPDGGIGRNGDGTSALAGDMGTASMNHRLYTESPYLHGGGAGFDSMVTMDYAVKAGARPKWMPPG